MSAGLAIAANVATVQVEYLENRRALFGGIIQTLYYGPPILNSVARRLEGYNNSPQRGAVTDRLNQEVERFRMMLEGRGEQQQQQQVAPMTSQEITGPRVEVLAEEADDANAIVIYGNSPEIDYTKL